MRAKGFFVSLVILGFVVSSCRSEFTPRLRVVKDSGANKSVGDLQTPHLSLSFLSDVDDFGFTVGSVEVRLDDSNFYNDQKLSDVVGEVVQAQFGNRNLDLVKSGNSFTGSFNFLSGTDMNGILGSSLNLMDLRANQILNSSSIQIPAGLYDYSSQIPMSNPLRQFFNCTAGSAPRWNGLNRGAVDIEIRRPEISANFNVSAVRDSGQFAEIFSQSPNLFELFFSPAERNIDVGAVAQSDIQVRLKRVYDQQVLRLNTNPPVDMVLDMEMQDMRGYFIFFQAGGC